ncbi:MAG TPA: CDP-alcohol phosphatidyltransferase family protein [Mycobacteriales bacterium]|nr:CDP-alcohol phosphatidyltransferase family protein [Mycobacteriales bacterium]
MTSRPTLAELRAVAQPPSVLGRVSGEHWAGKLYQRHLSIRLTRLVAATRVTPDALTWLMLSIGVVAALVLTIPHVWAAVVAALLVQLQGVVDCMDGELARWRRQTGPTGIYVDRIAHYVTDAGLAVAVGVHADGGFASIGGWTTVGLAAGFLVLLTKAETDLVHVARVQSGRPPITDTAEVAASHVSGLRRLRALVRSLPFNRVLLAIELSALALVAAAVDAGRGDRVAMQVLDVVLLAVAGIVVVGHLLAVVTSSRLR